MSHPHQGMGDGRLYFESQSHMYAQPLINTPYINISWQKKETSTYIYTIDYIKSHVCTHQIWTTRVNNFDYVCDKVYYVIWKKNNILWMYAYKSLYIDKVIEVWSEGWQLLQLHGLNTYKLFGSIILVYLDEIKSSCDKP